MTRSIYPVRLHRLEDQRHSLVVRKLEVENRLRLLKDQIRDARDRRDPTDALARERDEVINALNEISLALAQVRHTRSSEVVSYKSAFLKMAKRLLPKETYTEIALAANAFIRECEGNGSSEKEKE
jgi:hypothetical protein